MAELNRNENSKQPDQPDTVQQFILTWKWVNRLFNTNVYNIWNFPRKPPS